MDAAQDEADRRLLVLSPEYLASKFCRHELNRALKPDRDFSTGRVIPVERAECTLPRGLQQPQPLRVDLGDDRQAEPWDQLARA